MPCSAEMGDVTSAVSELKSALSDIPTVLLDDKLLHVLDDARAGADALEAFAVHPSIVVAVGAGGSGKSSVVNAIVGSDAVAVSPIRPTTTAVTAVGVAGSAPVDGVTEYVIVDGLPLGLIVVDTPPWDVADETVRQIMSSAALAIVVVTPSRYGDEATRKLLAVAKTSDSICVVANRMPQDMALREQIEDAISERIGIVPTVVIVEGDPIVVGELVSDVPLDGSAVARRSVLSRAVAGSSRRIAAGLTEAAREVGSLERVIDGVAAPVVGCPSVDASSEWAELRDLLVTAAMSAVSSFDDAVESSHDGDLARRVRSDLSQTESEPTIQLLDAWKDEVCARFRSRARIRIRKASARALVDRWSWIVSVDPTVDPPRRFKRLMKGESELTVSTFHEALVDLLHQPVAVRRQEWMAVVHSAGEYRPGVLFAAATALEGKDGTRE